MDMTRAVLSLGRIGALLALLAMAGQVHGFTAAADARPGPGAGSPLGSIEGWPDRGIRPSLLEPGEAFRLEVRASAADTVVVSLRPARQYYLYRDSIRVSVVKPAAIEIAGVTLPRGNPKLDPTFGTVEVFDGQVDALVALKRPGTGSGEELHLRVSYQGCKESAGLCYAPVEQTVAVALPAAAPAASAGASRAGAAASPSAASDDGRFREVFTSGGNWTVVAAFFGFGLLLAFTPCTLPMLPILSSIIVGPGQHAGRRQLVTLSCVYVLGMAMTYAIAGAAAGLAGTLLSGYLRNPWVVGGLAAIFVVLACSMFGLFELQLPTALQSRLGSGRRLRGGRVASVFGMGVLSAVIVGPCVSAALAGALLYIGQTRDVVLGGLALFALAVGMGVPLLVLGATAGTLLPRAGPWMESVKRVVGVAMLALAIYMASPLVPLPVQHLLWAALLVVVSVYLHAIDPLPVDAPGHQRLFKGMGVLALLLGGALLLGAASGSRDLLQPLAALRGAGALERQKLDFQRVDSLAELEQRLEAARGRPVMLDFWAEWCVSCLEMDRSTFSDPRVQARLGEMVLLRADLTATRPEHHELLRRFALFGPPGIVFFDREGRELPLRMIGHQSPEQFLRNLERLRSQRAWSAPQAQALAAAAGCVRRRPTVAVGRLLQPRAPLHARLAPIIGSGARVVQDLPFGTLLYRYFFFGWLFRDVTHGSMFERAAAWRHNREQARWLPTYLWRWIWWGLFFYGLGGVVEILLESPILSLLFYVPSALSVPVVAVTLAAWIGLKAIRGPL